MLKLARIAAEYFGATLLCVVLLAWIMDLRHTDLSIPLSWHSDALFFPMCVQGIKENGWYLHNERLGAPFALDMHDFPLAENWHFLWLRALLFIFPDPVLVLNVYFLLTFPLTTLAALFVLRHFRCSYPTALVGSLLFAFLPYHFVRGTNHILLSAYYLVPLMVMVVLWLWRDPAFLFVERQGKWRFHWRSGKTWASLVICVLTAGAGIYYACFGCIFLFVAGLAGRLSCRRFAVRSALMLSGAVVLAGLVNIAPTFWYAAVHGPNPDAARRNMGEAEHFGLRIAQLLMPVTGHRLPLLAWVKARFNNKLALVTENDHAALGLIGSIGFLLLVCRLLQRRLQTSAGPPFDSAEERANLLDQLSRLNIFAVLIATIGGFGLLFASAVPQIRSYNRISIFIGFFSLFGLALSLEAIRQGWARSRKRQIICFGVLALLVVCGVLDQTPAGWSAPEAERSRAYRAEADFVARIETLLPADAIVYQLPYRVFPEGASYEHLCGYLHSKSLRWSYPTMRGRLGDGWNRTLVDKPPAELVATLAFAGFEGIFVDRSGPETGVDAMEKDLAQLLGKPLVSSDGCFAFYNMTPYVERLRQEHPGTEWENRRELALHPVMVCWRRGFSKDLDVSAQGGRWCAAQGQMELVNPSAEPRTILLTMELRTAGQAAHLHVAGDLFGRELTITPRDGVLRETINVPPGRNMVRFTVDAPGFRGDPRRVFKVVRFQIQSRLSSEPMPP